MPYLDCPNCALTLARPVPIAWIDRCPRCLHRRRASIVLLDWGGPRTRHTSAEAGQPAPSLALGADHGRDGRTATQLGELAPEEEEETRNGCRGSRARAPLPVHVAGSAAAVDAPTP